MMMSNNFKWTQTYEPTCVCEREACFCSSESFATNNMRVGSTPTEIDEVQDAAPLTKLFDVLLLVSWEKRAKRVLVFLLTVSAYAGRSQAFHSRQNFPRLDTDGEPSSTVRRCGFKEACVSRILPVRAKNYCCHWDNKFGNIAWWEDSPA